MSDRTDVPTVVVQSEIDSAKNLKTRSALKRLKEWLEDEAGYDAANRPKAKQAIEEHRQAEEKRSDG